MDFDLQPLALYAVCALVAGVAISWVVAVWRPRRGASTAALAVLVLLCLSALMPGNLRPLVGCAAGILLVLLATAPRFGAVNAHFGDAARSLGASEARIFARLILPLAWRSILVGAALAFFAGFVV